MSWIVFVCLFVSDWLPLMLRLLHPGFLLDKKIGVNQPKRMENVKILIANTGMDTDKIKVHTHISISAVVSRVFFGLKKRAHDNTGIMTPSFMSVRKP